MPVALVPVRVLEPHDDGVTTQLDNNEINNEVRLRGRLAAEPAVRVLPSGDEICTFRVNVARDPNERVRVDSIDCASASARVKRSLARAVAGDDVAVAGRLQRRFWRSGSAVSSRYEVMVTSVKLAPRRRSGASTSPTPASE